MDPRPTLPIIASSDSASSSSHSTLTPAKQCIILSSQCLRDTVQKAMKEPGCLRLPRPDRDTMSCDSLLQYHAQFLLDSHLYPAGKRRRLVAKEPLSDHDVLQRMVKDPKEMVIVQEMCWA
jgi:hypothetical protein